MKGKRHCGDCGAKPGEHHTPGCDMERCPACGGQAITCGCTESITDGIPWTGEFFGSAECREYGLYSKFVDRKWVSCEKDDPEAVPDLNTLFAQGVWDRENKKIMPPAKGWKR
jgi:hypothetical protein